MLHSINRISDLILVFHIFKFIRRGNAATEAVKFHSRFVLVNFCLFINYSARCYALQVFFWTCLSTMFSSPSCMVVRIASTPGADVVVALDLSYVSVKLHWPYPMRLYNRGDCKSSIFRSNVEVCNVAMLNI